MPATPAERPSIVANPRFRNRVRELLVELPSSSKGLALRISGKEHVVAVFPRLGSSLISSKDLLALTWYDVEVQDADKGEWRFKPLADESVEEFLKALRDALRSEPEPMAQH